MEGSSEPLPSPGGASYCSEREQPSARRMWSPDSRSGRSGPWLMDWQAHKDWTTGESEHRTGGLQHGMAGWTGHQMGREGDASIFLRGASGDLQPGFE